MKPTINKKTKKAIPPRIVLLGFMCAGKTTAAKALAELNNCAFFDLDEFIEARENRSVRQIIENLGEAVFREIERDALGEILRLDTDCVVALGGGAWTIAENRNLIKQRDCRTVWLDAPFERCWRRIRQMKAARPLASGKKQTRRLFDERKSVYQKAEIQITPQSRQSARSLAAEIDRRIRETRQNG